MNSRRIALTGNPNAGKSTIFNALTGANQHVGNWPGKTVEKREGTLSYDGYEITVVDLPGSYSLSAYSFEEIITRDYIVNERPDWVIIVLDAANLERNLYLAVQVLELAVPAIVVLNMMDTAVAHGIDIDTERLSTALQLPIISTVARKGIGLEALLTAVTEPSNQNEFAQRSPARARLRYGNELFVIEKQIAQLDPGTPPDFHLNYGPDIEGALAMLQIEIGRYPALVTQFPQRWLAIKLLEEDADVQQKMLPIAGGPPVLTHAQLSLARLKETLGDDIDTLLADKRYGWIHDLVQTTTQADNLQQLTLSDRVDKIVTHRWLGIPIFLLAMWAVFKLTADVSAPYLDWIDGLFSGPITHWTTSVMGMLGLNGSWLESLLVDGVIAGVGGVLVFVPVLMALYLALALLEDSGYMARAAFVMDRSMSKIGLHGKSFLPLMVGFGCSVPAIYATRTLSDDKDRILTALLVPFMSCGARLPVYVLFAAIFFPQQASLVIFGLYLLGIATAVALGLLLRRTLFQQQEQTAFVMELPPYRLPTLRSIWLHMWQRTSAFIKSAWSLILIASVVIWLLMAIPTTSAGHFADTNLEESLFATAAQTITPIMAPLGFGEWQATSALITGFVAKEVVVSTLAQTYGATESPVDLLEPKPTFVEDLSEIFTTLRQATVDTIKALPLLVGIDLRDVADETADSTLTQGIRNSFAASSGGYGALAGLAFMIFVLIYTPCMVTISAQRQELGSKWMWLSIVGQLALAWLMAFIVFQVGVHLL